MNTESFKYQKALSHATPVICSIVTCLEVLQLLFALLYPELFSAPKLSDEKAIALFNISIALGGALAVPQILYERINPGIVLGQLFGILTVSTCLLLPSLLSLFAFCHESYVILYYLLIIQVTSLVFICFRYVFQEKLRQQSIAHVSLLKNSVKEQNWQQFAQANFAASEEIVDKAIHLYRDDLMSTFSDALLDHAREMGAGFAEYLSVTDDGAERLADRGTLFKTLSRIRLKEGTISDLVEFFSGFYAAAGQKASFAPDKEEMKTIKRIDRVSTCYYTEDAFSGARVIGALDAVIHSLSESAGYSRILYDYIFNVPQPTPDASDENKSCNDSDENQSRDNLVEDVSPMDAFPIDRAAELLEKNPKRMDAKSGSLSQLLNSILPDNGEHNVKLLRDSIKRRCNVQKNAKILFE